MSSADSGRVTRYTYDPAARRYTRDSGFPVTVTSGGTEAIVLDKGTTGQLWITYTQRKKVLINRTLGGGDRDWGEPFVPPVGGTDVSPDDISAVVAFDLKTAAPRIGVMWSNQNDDAMYFAAHRDDAPDGEWQATRTAVQGPGAADDHVNLKSLQTDSSGKIFAAVKTSLDKVQNPNPNAPQVLLSVLGQNGDFDNHVFGRVGDRHTRPMVLIDQSNRDLYMFATAPTGGGAIFYKKTSLNNISFASGRGTPFIQRSSDPRINDATSTKQTLDSQTGLLVLAADDTTGYYLHNRIEWKHGEHAARHTYRLRSLPVDQSDFGQLHLLFHRERLHLRVRPRRLWLHGMRLTQELRESAGRRARLPGQGDGCRRQHRWEPRPPRLDSRHGKAHRQTGLSQARRESPGPHPGHQGHGERRSRGPLQAEHKALRGRQGDTPA